MAERSEMPVQNWLTVWEHIERIKYSSNAFDREIHLALRKLYWLLEPPSVRELRHEKDAAVLTFVEEDE